MWLLLLCSCPVPESKLVNRTCGSLEKLEAESGTGGSGFEESLVVGD